MTRLLLSPLVTCNPRFICLRKILGVTSTFVQDVWPHLQGKTPVFIKSIEYLC